VNREQTAKLRAFVIAKAKAYAANDASYDDTCFTTDDAATHVGGVHVLLVSRALGDLEAKGLVDWHRPSATPGYWRATAKAAREVAL